MQTPESYLNQGIHEDSLPLASLAPVVAYEDIPIEPSTKTMVISPTLAEKWLGRNLHNRAPNHTAIQRYVRSMAQGQWALTGESIKFSTERVLLDGQNRLMAIMQSGVSVEMDVRFGLSPTVFQQLDTGKSRTIGQILGIRGEKQSSALGAALGVIWAYENRLFNNLGASGASHEELLETLEKHPRIRLSLEPGITVKKILRPGLSVAFHYLCCCKNKDQASFFWDRLASGENLSLDNPIYLLRERLSSDRFAAKTHTKAIEHAALLIKSWNAFSSGTPIKILKWMSHGKAPERFPLLSGDEE